MGRPTIKFKKLVAHAEMPVKATDGSSGYDVVAADYWYDSEHCFHEYGTGLCVDLPEGWEIEVRPRSSISKTSFVLVNSPGTIDSDYKKEIFIRFKEIDDRKVFYEVGDRIAQLVFKKVPEINLVEVEEIQSTDRGGFGSTGK